MRILIKGRQEGQSEREDVMVSGGGSDVGPRAKECGWLPEAGKDEETDSLLEQSSRMLLGSISG